MNNEYIIINRTTLEKRIEEVKEIIQFREKNFLNCSEYELELFLINRTLSQSTPLIPEIEMAFEQGQDSVEAIIK